MNFTSSVLLSSDDVLASNLNFFLCLWMQLGPKAEDVRGPWNPFSFAYRFIVGGLASLYYVLIPIYMWLKDLVVPKGQPI